MGRTLKVQLTNANSESVHDFRNFGEDVYRALRDECAVSIGEVDAATEVFHLRAIPKRGVRKVAAKVRKLVEPYPNLIIQLDEIREGNES